jgi:tRNA(adenine34) deaminase
MPGLTPKELMTLALDEAERAFSEDEVPVGALLLFGDGSILSAHNTAEASGPFSHAEILVLNEGMEAKGRDALKTSTLYVTIEPCLMCIGAMIHARIEGLVYGAPEPAFGGISLLEKAWKEGRYPYHFPIHGGLLAEESTALMQNFFRKLR